MAGGVGERIFLTMLTHASPLQAPHRFHSGRVQIVSVGYSEGDDVPSGRWWSVLSHAPFRRSRSKFSTTARLSYSCTSSRRATRSMWRCFSSSLRTPPAARKASRQRRFRRPAPAHFLLCPFNGRDGLIHQAGVLKMGGSASCASAGSTIFRDGVVTSSGSSLQVKQFIRNTG